MADENIDQLINEATRVGRIAEQKLEFVEQQIGIDPFTMLGLQQQIILDWFLPEFNSDGSRNVERLQFDIFSNRQLVNALDTIVRNRARQLHVIGNGKTSDENDADKPD